MSVHAKEAIRGETEKLLVTCKEYYEASDYELKYETDGIKMETKVYPVSPIPCFRCSGYIDATPSEVCDFYWSLPAQPQEDFDKSVYEWQVAKVIDSENRILYQKNKVPWPLWDRESLVSQTKYTESDGTIFVVAGSTEIPTDVKLDPSNYVRATVYMGALIFKPEGTGTRFTRLLLTDPEGNIPTVIVTMVADGMKNMIIKFAEIFDGKK
eukprot:TRINITY_DN1789_c0_g1_i2.p1 TRINITY_DN1789_c0_g1~~TRINITY_DN1789_c0_g1_i2.p1  ORF type:complete len:245 (+),score=43.82 TRINITY_DN1789_c0_g1_i2:104-736(+)